MKEKEGSLDMHILYSILGLFAFVRYSIGLLEDVQASLSEQTSFDEYINKSLLWAPYRSNCYFGIRPRNVNKSPFILGLMWFDNSELNALNGIRHFVEQGDKLAKYGWEVYDPRIGGKQIFMDQHNNLNLTVYFTKNHEGDNWAIRVKGEPLDKTKKTTTSVVLYFNQNGEDGISKIVKTLDVDNSLQFEGFSKELGSYELSIRDNHGEYYADPNLPTMEVVSGCDSSRVAHVSLKVPDDNVWMAKDVFNSLLADSVRAIVQEKGTANISPSLNPSLFTIRNLYSFPAGNFHYVQKTFDLSKAGGFEFDVTYNKVNSKEKILSSQKITLLITEALQEVEARFNRHFQIQDEDKEMRVFALETLSNLLGGIGYFHGTQMVDRETTLDDGQYEKIDLANGHEEGPLSLFTSVPSRAFFPRGFYWDEGFHLLQIMEYDFDLAFVIMSSWFDLIEDSGWIPREVILGNEARSKVPEEFTVQNPNIANPPVLLLAFSEMLDKVIGKKENLAINFFGDNRADNFEETSQLENNEELLLVYAKKIYPKLLRHYEWFRDSQRGSIDEWEEVLEDEELSEDISKNEVYSWKGRTIDHCLPSGLDDYPRAQPPDISELDVDALAWVGVMTRSMRKIAHILNFEDDERRYANIESDIVKNLDLLHWSEDNSCYCDLIVNDYSEAREFVCHEGYISLLPFALKLIPLNSPHLPDLINLMGDPQKLLSDFGLLSLSRQDEFFGTKENYWRGPIWMNINYLCLDAIKHYYPEVTNDEIKQMDETSKKAKALYVKLRGNLISNVFRVWKEKGYCYEAYEQNTGDGKSAEHFTGWTALIVNIIGQK